MGIAVILMGESGGLSYTVSVHSDGAAIELSGSCEESMLVIEHLEHITNELRGKIFQLSELLEKVVW